MPECPEITILSHYLLTNLKNKIFKQLEIISGKYTHKKLLGSDLLNENYKLKNVESKGKLLWMTFENTKKIEEKIEDKLYLISHLGLTGEWIIINDCDNNNNNNKNIRLQIEIKEKDKKDKKYLCYYDQRNFGNIELTNDYNLVQKKINKLAPDTLHTDFSNTDFENIFMTYIKKSKARKDQLIFKILMNQNINNGLLSGLGNYLTAEILYDCKISPFRTLKSLSHDDIINLAQSIKQIVKLSYFNNTTGYMTNFNEYIEIHKNGILNKFYPNYHDDIKLKKSDQFEFKIYRQKTDPYGNKVEADKTINKGRSTYWVPKIQK